MATKTASAAQANVLPKRVHAGTQNINSKYAMGGTVLSAGDVILGVKVPNGAVINSVALYATLSVFESAGEFVKFAVGDGTTADRFISDSVSDVERLVTIMDGLGYKYQLSDNDISQYDTIDVTIRSVDDASGSKGYLLLNVGYSFDQTSESLA